MLNVERIKNAGFDFDPRPAKSELHGFALPEAFGAEASATQFALWSFAVRCCIFYTCDDRSITVAGTVSSCCS